MDKKRTQNSNAHGQLLPQRKRGGSVLVQDQTAVDELCKILARILRRMNENDSLPSVID